MTDAPAARLPDLTAPELSRYGRHFVIPEVGPMGQRRLKAGRVLLVGAGGLGSPLALYLAAAGVGRIGIVEFDRVEATNLQRQVLYGESDLGRPKLEAAAERLRDVNPHVEIVPHAARLEASNALELVGGYDVVADGSDNFPTRYLVNDACVRLGRPNVWGAIQRFEGQLSVFGVAGGPCYRCLFPEPPPPGLVPSCAEAGVLGVLPGIVGALQANEVIKLLLGIGEPLVGRFVVFDALSMRFREVALAADPDCPACGEGADRGELIETPPACAAANSHQETDGMNALEISVADLDRWRREGVDHALVDVREPFEHEIARIGDDRLVPMRSLPKSLDELDRGRPLVLYCHSGNRSLHAAAFLRGKGFDNAVSLAGGIDAWSRQIDPSVPRY